MSISYKNIGQILLFMIKKYRINVSFYINQYFIVFFLDLHEQFYQCCTKLSKKQKIVKKLF